MPKFTHVVLKGSDGSTATPALAFDSFVESVEDGLTRAKNFTDLQVGGADAGYNLAFVVPIDAYAGVDGGGVYSSDDE